MNTRKWNLRRPLSLLLAVLLVVSGSLVAVSAAPTANGSCGENLTWVLENDTLTISGEGEMKGYWAEGESEMRYGWTAYKDQITTVVIENGVTGIGYYAFFGYTELTSVTIPDSVTSIHVEAFRGCTGLTSITIPDSLAIFSSSMFAGCTGLTSVTILDGVTDIGEGTFDGCTGLTSITIPDSVTYIGYSAFEHCTGLTSITIPNGVTGIVDRAFRDCTGLTSITIPDGVTSIGDSAFSGCTGLTSITIPDGVTYIGSDVFYNTGYYNNASNWKNDVLYLNHYLLDAKGSISGTYNIKEGTSLIADDAFYECAGLTSVTIPGSVTSIGEKAFCNCAGLTSITIPDSVTSIGGDAFCNCTGLTSITIPDSVTSIGGSAFYNTGYYNNTSNWDNDLLYIGNYLIKASSISGVCCIKEGTSLIANYAFSNTGLTNVTIPDSVTSIGEDAFYHCYNLTIYGTKGSYAETYANANNIPFSPIEVRGTCGENLIWVLKDGTLTISGEGEMKWGQTDDGMSYGWTAYKDYITAVVIENGITGIGGNAFEDCTGLTSITIPDSVTYISYEAFVGCTGLTSITIPDSVVSIGDGAFACCTGLTSVVIPNSVTSIGGAFYGCTGLTSVTIPDGVTSIGDSAFSGCIGLKSITIPESVTEIGYSAFSSCIGLTSITIPDSVTGIGESAFADCTGLTGITIPDGVTDIGYHAFAGCTGLTSITIPDGVKYIDEGAFRDTAYYKNESNWENGVLYLGKYLINVKESISGACHIKEGTSLIADDVFSGCTGLTSVTIPDSVTGIGWDAFEGCDNLTIYGTKGSYAETYAKECEIPFEEIGNASVPGDVNGDGVLGATDCLKARRAFFGLSPLTQEILRAVDFNKNGKIDATECLKQRRMFFGLI